MDKCSSAVSATYGAYLTRLPWCHAARVEWAMWTSSNDGCGNGCDRQAEFKKAMRSDAQSMETVRSIPSAPACMLAPGLNAPTSKPDQDRTILPRPLLLSSSSAVPRGDCLPWQ